MQRKIKTVGAAPSFRPRESVFSYPRFCLALSKPGSLRALKTGKSPRFKKKKSQPAVGRTRYIGLNIYTEALQNCTARAPGAAEAARSCRPAGQPRFIASRGKRRLLGAESGPGTGEKAGVAEEVPVPLGGPVREVAGLWTPGTLGGGGSQAPLNRPRRSLRLPHPPSSPGCWLAGP